MEHNTNRDTDCETRVEHHNDVVVNTGAIFCFGFLLLLLCDDTVLKRARKT